MEKSQKAKLFTGQVQLLLKTGKDFPEKLKQRLVRESNNVKNPFRFIVGLFTEGVLTDASSDPEANFGLKVIIVQIAMMIVCSKGADAIGGLMKALEGSGNSEWISALQAWVKKDFVSETGGDMRQPKEGVSAVETVKSEKLPKNMQNVNELSSSGTKLTDKITSRVQDDFMEQLEGHLVGKTSMILNTREFCSSLIHGNVLNEADMDVSLGSEAQDGQQIQKLIKAACSKKPIGSLVLALQRSENERLLQETLEWLEKAPASIQDYPVAVKSLPDHRIIEERKGVRPIFLKQTSPSSDLEKVATLNFPPPSSAKGPFAVELDGEKMMASFDDGTIKLGNWITNEEKTIKFGEQVKDITSFQYDEEIFILGTAAGTVHLFDATTMEEQFSVRLGQPVQYLRFVESTLVTVTWDTYCSSYWWIEISRSDMRLLNQKVLPSGCTNPDSPPRKFFVDSEYLYLYFQVTTVWVYSTKLGSHIRADRNLFCSLDIPADMNAFKVVDLISTKRYVVAGCRSGNIALWNTSSFVSKQKPDKTLRGHTGAVVSLCALKGHLLSLDTSGKLLMWSGYDLENKNMWQPVPRVLSRDFSYGTDLVAHQRWFASRSSEDGIVSVWTLPDLWLRTG